jgi:hypothetical protein
MPTAGITIDVSSIRKAILGLSVDAPKRFKTRINRAIGETQMYAEDQMMKLLVEKYAISAGRLKSGRGFGFERKRPSEAAMNLPLAWGGTGGQAVGEVVLHSRRLPVIDFYVSPRKVPNQRGIPVSSREVVTFSVIRGESISGKPNKFLAIMPGGHLGLFKRKDGATKSLRPDGQWTQLPIQEAFMISPSEMVAGRRISPILERRVMKYFLRALNAGLQKNVFGGPV